MDFQNESDLQVQKILDKKVFNGKTLYLVKWKNYPIQQATWECNKLLTNVKDKIREFKNSKRSTEDIPNIKFQEDMAEGQIRDTFKRKRGRPPRMSFNSYRELANQPQNIIQDGQIISYSHHKRGRGRPRGSKNKKAKQTHFQDSSSLSYESQESQNPKNPDRTMTNSDSSQNQLNQKKTKKLKKLSKIHQKAKSKIKATVIHQDQQCNLQIVDSQNELGRPRIKMKQNEVQRQNQFQRQQSNQITLETNEINTEKGKKDKNLGQILSQNKASENRIKNQEVKKTQVSNQQNTSQKKNVVIIRRYLGEQKQKVNVQTNCNKNQISLLTSKKVSNVSNLELKQLSGLQKDGGAPTSQLDKNKPSIQEQNKLVQQTFHNQNNQALKDGNFERQFLPTKRTISKSSENNTILIPKNTLTDQKQETKKVGQVKSLESEQSSHSNFYQNHQKYQTKKHKRNMTITKIYLLETIQLYLFNQQFPSQYINKIQYQSFSQQQLQRMSSQRQIIEILNNHSIPSMKNKSQIVENHIQNKSQSYLLYQQLSQIIQRNHFQDNDDIVDSFVQRFKDKRSHPLIVGKQDGEQQRKVNEAVYLVQYNQGKIIKKMSASELLLHMIIDQIKIQDVLKSQQSYEFAMNFMFYIKFLQNTHFQFGPVNESLKKTQKPSIRNIKIESNIEKQKSEFEKLMEQVVKKIKNPQNTNHLLLSKSNKKKLTSNGKDNIKEKISQNNSNPSDINNIQTKKIRDYEAELEDQDEKNFRDQISNLEQ